MNKITVMIVDDTAYMRNLLKKILESDGYVVVAEAEDGSDALQFYKRYTPDLVTLDISMPFTNGVKVLEKIKAINPDAKVIMVSSSGNKKNVIDAAKFGASHFIVKPFTREKVLETVALVMEKQYIPKFIANVNLEALKLTDHVTYSDVVSVLANETGIEKEDAEDILARFLESVPHMKKQLDDSFDKKDFSAISDLAHQLKGALLNLRFRNFSQVAESLDFSSREGNKDLVEKYYKLLKEWLIKIENLQKEGEK